MKPFDLPLDNLFDVLHADLCRPTEVRESYLSNPPDAGDHEHVDRIEQQPQALDEPIMPPSFLTPPQQWAPQYRRRPQAWLYPGMPLPLSAAVVEDGEQPPPSRIITVPQRPQQPPQTRLFPGVPE